MTEKFLTENFLLQNKSARILYHEYAEKMPIYDYHCHLPAEQIAEDHQFRNLTQTWLYGDHYKWRAMRTNGINEKYCTGQATDYEKFQKWARTVPYLLRNPLYHWTHMELKTYFGINKILNPDTAKEIYEATSQMLQTPQFSVRNLLRKMNIKLVCTTEGPLDSLQAHRKVHNENFDIKVYSAFRPDKALAVENINKINTWIDRLAEVSNIEITDLDSFLQALQHRHDYFHENGCRLSDYGIETVYAEEYTENEINRIFKKIRTAPSDVPFGSKSLDITEILKFKSVMLHNLVSMDARSGWVTQLHLGALRNNNTRMFEKLGPDCGCDSMGDFEIARPLVKFLDTLDKRGNLPKTILYNLNPKDTALFTSIIGSFQNGSFPGKMQYGASWWFLDNKDGIEEQIKTLSNLGLLSRFIGMLTDSRSFLSYPRHDYFRRILCNLLGNDMEQGLLPNDPEMIGSMVRDICFNNAAGYFPMKLE